jgi:hypothetical protein
MMTHSTGILGMQFCALDLPVIEANANDVVLLYPCLITLRQIMNMLLAISSWGLSIDKQHVVPI